MILVVDDDNAIRLSLKMLLQRLRYVIGGDGYIELSLLVVEALHKNEYVLIEVHGLLTQTALDNVTVTFGHFHFASAFSPVEQSQFKSDMFKLRSFLSLEENVDLEPVIPSDIPKAEPCFGLLIAYRLDAPVPLYMIYAEYGLTQSQSHRHPDIPKAVVGYDDVLDKALANNSFAKNIRRRQLEADYEVAKAKGNMREITLFAQIGYTGTADKFGPAYDNLKDNQVVEIGFRIPLLDWGKRRGKVKVALFNSSCSKSFSLIWPIERFAFATS